MVCVPERQDLVLVRIGRGVAEVCARTVDVVVLADNARAVPDDATADASEEELVVDGGEVSGSTMAPKRAEGA